jgi:glycosyltransferase involved in cell wall biosynthesis
VAELERRLDRFTAARGRLVWTVHNVVPHDATYPDAEVAVCRLLAERARLVHVLSPETLTAVAPYYPLDPDRVVVVPHSSYLGVYPARLARGPARRRLGLGREDRVLVTFGRIRPYKGIERLLDALKAPPLDDPRLRLLVAGAQGAAPGVQALVDRLTETPRVVVHAQRVPPREVQVWMRSADLAVLPYTAILNSGAFLLAETFGLPVVAPRAGALAAREGQPHVRLFDDGDFEAVLASAVRDLVESPEGAAVARESALAAAAANPPEEMARRFAAAVAPLLG